jgi:hypothetical protein
MIETSELLKKAAEKCNFIRESYNEAKIPTSIHNVCILPFFGDIKGTFVLSTLLLKRYRDEIKSSKYFILCSWPGFGSLYKDCVDEYWSIKDYSSLGQLYSESIGFCNESNINLMHLKDLNQYFYEVITSVELVKYYNDGLTDDFVERFGNIKRSLPMIPSRGILGVEFNRALANRPGYKIMIYPTTHVKVWRHKLENKKIDKKFWVALVERLLKEGLTPVVLQGFNTYDISRDFSEKCIYFTDKDISKVMSAMRSVDCVLDVFNDISRLACIARTPYLTCMERTRFINQKEYELDDLCVDDLPKQYIFNFSTILDIDSEEIWNLNIFDNIISRLNLFLPDINKDALPNTSELTEEISYKQVRVRKMNRLGTKFIKVNQD